jgi:hypothetical protein
VKPSRPLSSHSSVLLIWGWHSFLLSSFFIGLKINHVASFEINLLFALFDINLLLALFGINLLLALFERWLVTYDGIDSSYNLFQDYPILVKVVFYRINN